MSLRLFAGLVVAVALSAVPSSAPAWSIGNPLDTTGCHEEMTAAALRTVRARFTTAPPLTPTRDEAALIALVQFTPPADFLGDLAAMSLLLGVRDNDLKGTNPLESLDLAAVHGDPDNQDEHCIRSASDDGEAGQIAALAACRAFIRAHAIAALDGLDADGTVDASIRVPLEVYVSVSGEIEPPLPLFYVEIGRAIHALEDGFTHSYRTPDGAQVTVVLNWIEFVGGTLDPARDGPAHNDALDNCDNTTDPTVVRNFRLAHEAATALLAAALDPGLTRAQKIAEFDAITAQYLTFEEGCTLDNRWCDAPEANVIGGSGCDVAGPRDARAGLIVVLIVALGAVGAWGLRRQWHVLVLIGCVLLSTARADEPVPPLPPAGHPDAPIVPTPPKAEDVVDASKGKEPGRDVKTPTVAEVQSVREDKRLGPRAGFALSLGGSTARGAAIGRVGVRYRLDERWLLGLDAEWNPWITSAPLTVRSGSLNASLVLVRRFPLSFERLNLRTSLRLGASVLLFDVYGAAKYSVGPFAAVSILGLDYDLGSYWRLVFDPIEWAVPMPVVTPLPLYYDQYRIMFGLQYGS